MEGSLPRVFAILKKLNLTSAISFGCNDWQLVNATGVARIADLSFYSLAPCQGYQLPVFNTDNYAKEAIRNATLAGSKPGGLTLQVPLLAAGTILYTDIGYSEVIYDYNADQKGNGSLPYSLAGYDGYYYFFSQARLVDKIALARKYKLHGVMLQGGRRYEEDLLPWDNSSLFYALVSGSEICKEQCSKTS